MYLSLLPVGTGESSLCHRSRTEVLGSEGVRSSLHKCGWSLRPPGSQRFPFYFLCLVSILLLLLMGVVVLQSLNSAWVSATPWTAARQPSLSFTVSWSLLRFMPIESVMPSNHPILLSPSPPALNLSQHEGLFQWVTSSHQMAKELDLQLQHQSFQWIWALIFFRMDLFDLLAFQGTLQSLLQHHSSKASILQRSAFFMVQLSHLYMTTGKTMSLTK